MASLHLPFSLPCEVVGCGEESREGSYDPLLLS